MRCSQVKKVQFHLISVYKSRKSLWSIPQGQNYQLVFLLEGLDRLDHGRSRLHEEVLESSEGWPVRRHLGPALQQDLIDLVGAGVGLAQTFALLVDLPQDLRPVETDPFRKNSASVLYKRTKITKSRLSALLQVITEKKEEKFPAVRERKVKLE